jgi:hypothetical protein
MEHIQFGGRRVAGFGVGKTIEEVTEELEKSDPCAACHHDTYSKLKTFGTIIATAVVTAGVLYIWEKK